MRPFWIGKLQHLLQTSAFCLAVAALQYAFAPDKPYLPPVAYALAIGLCTWAVIDFGRHLAPSARETGWPAGWLGPALVAIGILVGYVTGHAIAHMLCSTFGWYAGPRPDSAAELRSSLLISTMAGIVGSFYFYARSKAVYLERQMAAARGHADEARLKLLESQLEPHMLFNTLANLRALIGTDPARAEEMLDHLIAYLRATLAGSRATLHSLAEEFARLDDYLALMQVRMGARLSYALELPAALAAATVPSLLLQPLVENSIRHGLEPLREGGRIDVRAGTQGSGASARLVLEVRDTGVGLAQAVSATAADSGFGCRQVRDRLATLYGAAGTIELIANNVGGTCATVLFPLENGPSAKSTASA